MDQFWDNLILKMLPINAVSSFTSASWVASLNDKAFDIAMEECVIVVAFSSKG